MTHVSRETDNLLATYQALIHQWNPRINLVAPSTLPDFKNRHLADCLQLADLAKGATGHWVDLGSGGGLPGIVMATVLRDASLQFTFVESDRRKGEFLRTALRELGLKNVKIKAERIEQIEPLKADHISARALAPLPNLLGFVDRHIATGGTAWLMKGRTWRDEVAVANKTWRFELDAISSRTEAEAAILKISGVSYA
ncbi:MAG: 16S rRNA (guanine(527)-N(7))-methyltransferase RsmG [Paracoccus sp. (in: a-proteobacteria)]|nr:16S rRNA (guanine(527)-N(7))-methyltransferase RsmG [Paracoccus sp. (in: a-proteobacteria)]